MTSEVSKKLWQRPENIFRAVIDYHLWLHCNAAYNWYNCFILFSSTAMYDNYYLLLMHCKHGEKVDRYAADTDMS